MQVYYSDIYRPGKVYTERLSLLCMCYGITEQWVWRALGQNQDRKASFHAVWQTEPDEEFPQLTIYLRKPDGMKVNE